MIDFRGVDITNHVKREAFMLRAAIAFFVIGLIAMLLGAGGVAGLSMEVGRTLLFVFLALAVISFIVSLVSGRSSRNLP